ncbi:MAG: hypothetical protein IH934_07690 [Nanoarchaeota archaeon]|nr:hypothetical protein [Nanoarchaeota archaeon]
MVDAKMFQEYIPQISKYLANAVGVNPSKIIVGEVIQDGSFIWGPFKIPFLLDGQEIGYASANNENSVPLVTFRLPPSEAGKSYAPFSMKSLTGFDLGFDLKGVRLTYYINEHPEFKEVLKHLRVNERIPRQKICGGNEPEVYPLKNGDLEGKMIYILGTPSEERLCIQVEPKDVKYIPEADEQVEQQHHCIHGEDAPVNPFDTNPKNAKELSVVSITLSRLIDPIPELSIHTSNYLEETLEGLLVPADGLALEGIHTLQNEKQGGLKIITPVVKLRTPYENFIEIKLNDPLTEEDWENKIKLARNLEAMFKE